MDLKGAKIRNIKELCMDIESKYSVPLYVNVPCYQRPYKWDKERIQNLIYDFQNNKKDGQQIVKSSLNEEVKDAQGEKEYFVGSVVLVKNVKETARFDLIDGQQRITTIFLLNYLKYILLKGYIEEILLIRRWRLESYLNEFEKCYYQLFGSTYTQEIRRVKEDILKSIDSVNDMQSEEFEEEYKEAVGKFQHVVGLPKKNLSDSEKYLNECWEKNEELLQDEHLALAYSRESYNEKIKKALANISVLVSKDSMPQIKYNEELKDEITKQYLNALVIEFNTICEYMDSSDSPLEFTCHMIDFISDMIDNIKFCVIITGNVRDAYVLFEVLNDRALEIDDLDLIKNQYFKEYCVKSGDPDTVIDKNIEKLDSIWGDEIFENNVGATKVKLISYLGTIYLTADQDIVFNKVEKYRETLADKYFNEKYKLPDQPYTFEKIKSDIMVYKMIRIIIDEFHLPMRLAKEEAIKAECDVSKSITYRAFYLLNALKMYSVMPALVNLIIKTYRSDCKQRKQKEDMQEFTNFVRELTQKKEEETNEIHRWAYEIWRMVLCSKDYGIPRELARLVIGKINHFQDDRGALNVSVEQYQEMFKQLRDWTTKWQYGKSDMDFRIKILFINLFQTDRIQHNLKLNSSVHTFVTSKLQLDHLEAQNPNGVFREKYFMPQDQNETRDKYVNSLGNFMILDGKNNNSKDNIPLCEAIPYYEKMSSNHWMIEEVKDMLQDAHFRKCVHVDDRDYYVPTEAFFLERRSRLQKYFEVFLKRKIGENEMKLE